MSPIRSKFIPKSPPPEKEPSPRDRGIEELIQRLHVREFHRDHVREAAQVVAQVQTHKDSLRLARRLIGSPLLQVRHFAEDLLQAIAPKSAQADPSSALPARNGVGMEASETDSREAGFVALAEVIKHWIHEEKQGPWPKGRSR